jgi:predicted MFS family arabinose efflux permease
MNQLAKPRFATALQPVAQGTGYTLFVLFLVNFLNYFDRIVPAVVLEPIRLEFGLNDTKMGLVTTAFTVVYAALAIPMGQLVDRLSRKKILAVSVGIWSMFTAASGLAAGFIPFLTARMGVGVGEAGCTPAATSLIGDLLPEGKRAKAYGAFMLGLPLGTFAALALVGLIAADYGWRAAFLVAALPGAAVALMLLGCCEPARGMHDSVRDVPAVAHPMRAVLSSPVFWAIGLVGIAMSMAGYAMTTYLPAFFARTYGLGISHAGAASAIVLGLSGVVGLIAGGAISDRMAAGRPYGRVLFGMVTSLSAAPLVYLGLNAGDALIATVLLGLGWTLYFVYLVTAHTTLIDRFDSRLRGRAIGAFVFLATIGAAGGSALTGLLSDRFAAAAAATGAGEAIARSAGLQQALSLVVPGGLLLGALGYAVAVMALRRRRGA